MPVPNFTNVDFTVKQADTQGRLEVGDSFILTDQGGSVFKMSVIKAVGDPWEADLQWNEELACLEGPLRAAVFVTRISFYEQRPPEHEFELKVLYGAIIETDPESVGAWAADDQPPP
jgi:hypothetical protein